MPERRHATATFDVAVVGAGPAGLAAVVTAAERGVRAVLVDAGSQPGGQYWRHPDERNPLGEESQGHHDWRIFDDLRSRFRALVGSGVITYLPDAQVWFIDSGPAAASGDPSPVARVLHLTPVTTAGDGILPRTVSAPTLVLCPGGYDRQLPVPGWDLPGVMAAGGVQALLKGHRTLAGRRAVVAGTGPFLLPVATGLADAGAEVVAVCEANHLAGWARHARAAAGVPSKAVEALGYAVAFTRHRIPYRSRTAVTSIDGTDAVTGVTLSRLDAQGRATGRHERLEVDLVALGWGFTPSLELISAVGAETRVDVDESLVAVVDDRQHSSVPGILVAGEATGVGGALLAVAEGRLAGLVAAAEHGRPAPAGAVSVLQRRIGRLRAFATAMHEAHPIPRQWQDWLTADTTVCRCEEVTYGTVRDAIDFLGAEDARGVKLLARPGMGWCQGRVCGFATAKLAATSGGRALAAGDLRPVAKQSLCAPVSLEDLAAGAAEPDHE